jgi:hypothetical protein
VPSVPGKKQTFDDSDDEEAPPPKKKAKVGELGELLAKQINTNQYKSNEKKQKIL